MEMDKTRRVQIISIILMALLVIGLFLLVSGRFIRIEEAALNSASPLVCPSHTKLIIHRKNVEIHPLPAGQTQRKFTSKFECVGTDGAIVQNKADLILESICILPFFLLMLWGFAPPIWKIISANFRIKKGRPIRAHKK